MLKFEFYLDNPPKEKTMSTDLTVQDQVEYPVCKYATEEMFQEVSSASAFLPRLALCGANSELAKEGKIAVAHWAIQFSKDEFIDLGKEVNLVVLAWRPKALQMGGDNIIAVYDPKDPEFGAIRERSETPQSQAMYGPEFLVWIPAHKKFATYFMGSKTARNEARSVHALMKQPSTLRGNYIKTERFSWHGPKISKCSLELEAPNQTELLKQLEKFANPPQSTVEAAAEPASNPDV